MRRTENLELVLNNLQSNMVRLRNDIARLDSATAAIYYKWTIDLPKGSTICDAELNADLARATDNSKKVSSCERQLKFQTELYGKLLYTYSVLMGQDLAKIFRKN